MDIERKEDVAPNGFPEFDPGGVVEIFKKGVSQGLYLMCDGGVNNNKAACRLVTGVPWSTNGKIFEGADYAIEIKGKFVEE